MVFFWALHIVSLIFLMAGQYFFDINITNGIVLLSFFVLSFLPLYIPLVGIIREDMTPMRSLVTTTGLVGIMTMLFGFFGLLYIDVDFLTCIFAFVWAFSIFFRVESRIFFFIALIGLFVTMSALIVEQDTLAESVSILVYLALVIGVSVEIFAPWFDKIHSDSKSVIHISSEFKQGYYSALSEYAWIMTIFIQFTFFIAIFGRGTVWDFSDQMLLYLAFGIAFFFGVYLFSQEKILRITDFVADKFSQKYYIDAYLSARKYTKYGIVGFLFTGGLFMVNWEIVWNLPQYTLIGFVLLIISIVYVTYSSYPFFQKK